MQKLTFLTIGTLKEDYFRAAVAEYEKRISGYCRIESVSVKEEILRSESDAEIAAALEKEGDRVLAAIPRRAYVIALCVEGKELSSPELSGVLERAYESAPEVCFIIGSSYGLSDRVKAAADLKLSVSRMTFPHRLMRVILAEAVYRALTIAAGARYHK